MAPALAIVLAMRMTRRASLSSSIAFALVTFAVLLSIFRSAIWCRRKWWMSLLAGCSWSGLRAAVRSRRRAGHPGGGLPLSCARTVSAPSATSSPASRATPASPHLTATTTWQGGSSARPRGWVEGLGTFPAPVLDPGQPVPGHPRSKPASWDCWRCCCCSSRRCAPPPVRRGWRDDDLDREIARAPRCVAVLRSQGHIVDLLRHVRLPAVGPDRLPAAVGFTGTTLRLAVPDRGTGTTPSRDWSALQVALLEQRQSSCPPGPGRQMYGVTGLVSHGSRSHPIRRCCD